MEKMEGTGQGVQLFQHGRPRKNGLGRFKQSGMAIERLESSSERRGVTWLLNALKQTHSLQV